MEKQLNSFTKSSKRCSICEGNKDPVNERFIGGRLTTVHEQCYWMLRTVEVEIELKKLKKELDSYKKIMHNALSVLHQVPDTINDYLD